MYSDIYILIDKVETKQKVATGHKININKLQDKIIKIPNLENNMNILNQKNKYYFKHKVKTKGMQQIRTQYFKIISVFNHSYGIPIEVIFQFKHILSVELHALVAIEGVLP